ncbi:MAG: DUF2460 domain-containing protein [Rickettsia endosymbiont of Gnoriste bilineata]|nr:DUF2460 domain-containing protein [Rickettsia endosymbiont of Gnoriste bilineata]
MNKPVAGSEEFYVNGVNLAVQLDYNTGVLTLPRPLDKEQILTGNFIFDVAVRFTNDSFEYSYSPDGSIELSQIELLEVI